MIDLMTVNAEIEAGINRRYFKNDDTEKAFKNFCRLEQLKNIQSVQTMKNIDKQLFENVNRNKTLPQKDALSLFNNGYQKKAVLMAFGPSLRNTKEKILAVKTKYDIIGVDRGFYWYEKENIPTEYILACDVESSPDWIPNKALNGNKLIAFAGCSHSFCRKWVDLGGELYFYVTSCRLGTHHKINDIMPVKCCINGSGNIGHIQLVFAITVLNYQKVFLVGYDNSWGNYYYPDKKYDGREDLGIIETVDIKGKSVYSTRMWQMLTQYIYDFITDYQLQEKVINCTEGGIIKLKNHSELT